MSATRNRRKGSTAPAAPLLPVEPAREICLELEDHSAHRITAGRFFPARDRRTAPATQARLAEQFLFQNQRLFETLGLRASVGYDGSEVHFELESSSCVGAVPLVSPLSGRPDFGLVIQPRFPWRGLGPMLGQMGWRVVPRPLRLPLLRRSERRVPPWVISLMVLERLEALVQRLHRRFEFSETVIPAPKGSVRWQEYATRHVAQGRPDQVPCRFPDLRDDRLLKGMIRWTAEAQVRSLSGQLQHGAFIHMLFERAHRLLGSVRDVVPVRPTAAMVQSMARLPLRSEALQEGLEAIEWTAEERGLAGLFDLEGIPWVMDMDLFFEAWVECVLERISRHTGGILRRGRLRQTQIPLRWERPTTGTQLSLVPDFVLEAPDFTLIADAKYKRHLEEFASAPRWELASGIRERHREDILQVLAYSSAFASRRRVALLVYPCRKSTWDSLQRRGLLVQKALVPAPETSCELWLTSFPMEAAADEAGEPLIHAIRDLRLQAA